MYRLLNATGTLKHTHIMSTITSAISEQAAISEPLRLRGEAPVESSLTEDRVVTGAHPSAHSILYASGFTDTVKVGVLA